MYRVTTPIMPNGHILSREGAKVLATPPKAELGDATPPAPIP